MGILDRLIGSPRDKFAAEALQIAQRAPGVAGARYDREKFALAVSRPGERAPTWIYLSNVYGDSRDASRAQRREQIERLVRIMAAPHEKESWESVQPKLRPVLRPGTFGQTGVIGMVPPISRPALPYLRELVVVDRPESMAYVVPSRLDEWHVTAEEVFAAARTNLEGLADASLRRQWPGDKALVRMIDTGDGYFTSLPLAPGWLAGVSERMGAPAIAFVPDTNTVVLCGLPAGELGQLYEMIEKEYGEAVRGLSPVGYVADGRGRLVRYAPPPGHPDHVAARRAEVVLAAAEYGVQTQWLTQQYAQEGMDVFVGSLLAVARPGEPAVTVATWTDGITSLLPEAQFIAFARDGASGPRVPWQVVADLVDVPREPLLVPTRYRVGDWPAPDVMEALRAHAVD